MNVFFSVSLFNIHPKVMPMEYSLSSAKKEFTSIKVFDGDLLDGNNEYSLLPSRL